MADDIMLKARPGEVVAFCCEHSGVNAAEAASELGFKLPGDLRLVPVPCSGKVDVWYLLKALESGARGVMVVACHDGACHFLKGNRRAKSRVQYAREKLSQSGWAPERVAIVNVGPMMGAAFTQAVEEFYAGLEALEQKAVKQA